MNTVPEKCNIPWILFIYHRLGGHKKCTVRGLNPARNSEMLEEYSPTPRLALAPSGVIVLGSYHVN